MKKIWIFTLVFIISITACYSCKSDNKNDDINFSEENNEAQDKEFYTLSDFEGIVIGKSTLDDVRKVGRYTFGSYIHIYGSNAKGLVEYPMSDNSYIQIQFDENDVVLNINITSESAFAVEKYYKLSDFDNIIIGQSTLEDVNAIGEPFHNGVRDGISPCMSYPLEDGTFLRISFDFLMTVVIDKEVYDEP